MRVEGWKPDVMDAAFENLSIERLVSAAEVLADNVRMKCPVGTVSRPIYKSGPYAGQAWTARDAGQLKKSIRVVRKKTKTGRLSKKKNVRVYAGHYLAYYASIVEYSKPFMRPAIANAIPAMRAAAGAK